MKPNEFGPFSPEEINRKAQGLIQPEYGLFIDGEWVPSATGKTIELYNPATGTVLTKIQAGGAADVEKAVQAAHRAFSSWSQSAPRERQEILLEMARRLRKRLDDYAMMETLNNGKPISEARVFDIPMAISLFELFAGGAYTLHGKTIDYPDAVGMVHREPYGVCAQIIPWNVPIIMMANKIAPAIVSGNTVVLKPAETVCVSVLEFFREMQDIIPKGVVNVVTGFGGDVGPYLVEHPLVQKVAFTGSVGTARKILEYSSKNIIPATLELGGKSANIVFADADLDAAVEGAVMCNIFNKGEVCLSGTRLFVEESILDVMLDKLKDTLAKVRIGDPTNPATQLGPQASLAQFKKVCGYFDLAREEGAEIAIGGKPAKVPGLDQGYFVEPTLFTKVDNKMRIAQEEIFGPVTCVIPFKTEEEALQLANQSFYGLGGGLWTKDLRRAHQISRGMQTGTIWVNRYYNFKEGMPVGGYKQSGVGREFSLDALEHYTQTKSVVINLNEGPLGIFSH